ncbi:hypothetical protein ACLMJK_009390 [Lecanora helva]
METERSDFRFCSNRYGDLFEIVPFGKCSHPLPVASTLWRPARLATCGKQHYPNLKSPTQTVEKSVTRCETSVLQEDSRLDSDQALPEPMKPPQPSTPHFRLMLSPRTLTKSTKDYQPSTPRFCSAHILPLTPIIPAEPRRHRTIQRSLVSDSPQELFPEASESHYVRAPASPSAEETRVDTPVHRSVSLSPLRTPCCSAKASRRLIGHGLKPSAGKLQSSNSTKVSGSYLSAGRSHSQESPSIEFINLTSDDSAKILAGVDPSGCYKTMARRKRFREQSSRS